MKIKAILLGMTLLFCGSLLAQRPITSHVITHNRSTIICDPVNGAKEFSVWRKFPSKDHPVRKITMHVTLGSPDSLHTAHWDYLDYIVLRRNGGKLSKPINYELGRMLTPYGSVFNKGWDWKWEVDVTDFAPLLRDSVEIVYIHSGYEEKTVGWALTIDFEIVSGPEILTPIAITPLWNKIYKYGDPNEPIEDHLLPIKFNTSKEGLWSRIRLQHTGHGMDKPRGCSEFCSRWREITLDGVVVDRRDMWKKCGDNALYPQGGTWIYNRAYWCPGDLQQPDVIDVYTKPGNHQLAMQMEPYAATDNIQAAENISSFLFQYAAPQKHADVAVEAIMVPSNEQRYFRLNPTISNPRIAFRNLGAEAVRTLTIEYGTEGFPMKTYYWKGNLPFNQVAEVVLPGEIEGNATKNVFRVNINKPNGKTDVWPYDNIKKSEFVAPRNFPTNFIVEFLTNNKPEDNFIYLVNTVGDTLYRKEGKMLEAATTYRDTLGLPEGKHILVLLDSVGNGLQFWAQPQYGDGHLRLFDLQGNLIHAFESDCGVGEAFSFNAIPELKLDPSSARSAFSLYPRVVTDHTVLTVVSNQKSQLIVQFTVDGVLWQEHTYKSVQNGQFKYKLEDLPKGRIIVEAFVNGISQFKGRINRN